MSQPSPLSPARQRALALASAGDLAGARAILEHAVELGKVNLSEDDPDVLQTAFQLGSVLQQADDPAGARRVLEEAYAAGQWRLGDSDPLMLRISHDIGVVAEELGNRHEARKAFGRVAELGPGELGADHWAVIRARAYLGQGPTPPVRSQAATGDGAGVPSALEEPTAALWPVDEPDRGSRWAVLHGTTNYPPPVQAQRGAMSKPAADDAATSYPEPAAAQVTPADEMTPDPAVRTAGQVLPHPLPPHVGGEGGREPGYFAGEVVYPVAAPRPARAYGKGGLGLFAAIAAVLAAVVAVAALVFVLANRSSDESDSPDVPTLGGPAPTDVRLRDSGTEITVSWTDPSDGSVSFMVAMSHPGEQLRPMSTLGPGQTSYEAAGLNPKLSYCFAVIAVYRNNKFASSPQTCTVRPSAS